MNAADGFRPRGRIDAPVHQLDRRVCLDAFRRFRAADGFEAFVAVQVIERAVAIGRAREPMEWMGLLVGRICDDGEGRYVLVLGMVLDREAVAERHDVRSTHESEASTRQLARDLFPDCSILGWIHGHVRHGVIYSSVDRANQRTWQQPHAIGIVVDPWSSTLLSVYRGPDAELLRPAATVVRSAPEASEPAAPRCVARRHAPRRRVWWTWRRLFCVAHVVLAAAVAWAIGRRHAEHARLVAVEGRQALHERALVAIGHALPMPVIPRGEVCREPRTCFAPARPRAGRRGTSLQRVEARLHEGSGGVNVCDGRSVSTLPSQGGRP